MRHRAIRAGRLAHPHGQYGDGEQRGNHGDPENRSELAVGRGHDRYRQQRPGDGARGVHGLAQAVGRPEPRAWRDVGHQGVSRRDANSLADAIEESRREYPAGTRR